eukprot:CAMPEP_0115060750 /NCGR_PEP_ID=MMETSP0227-20121206/7628_1 /TAXON_ID=89957 /ORGANISM="Polarella glacialis, Strain CCMP 1383" /LENGTH=882 /DNA_ID=CAMNT_0002445981 /DNA_START=136 /DNA_END=2784 /DNA_ORIENTATION=-
MGSGCGCVSQHQVGEPRQFLQESTRKDFVRKLEKHELKDKKLLLEYFLLEHEGQFVDTDAFRELVRRRGVPERFRWKAWRALTGWSALYKPGEYERIMKKTPEHKTADAIDKDLDRTFPGVEEFDEAMKQDLAQVLRGFASLFPKVGYCQGMNFVAGFLLLAASGSPEGRDGSGAAAKDAFFLLVQMMVKYRANLLFCEGLPLLKLHTFQFRVLLQKLFPDVHLHFVENQITAELYLTKWILTMFTQTLPYPSAARIWDLIVCDGLQALVLVALATVKLLKPRLLREETEGILELLSLKGLEDVLSGGEIVKHALALQPHLPSQCQLNGAFRCSNLYAEWERSYPDDAADFTKAELEICGAREESPLEQTEVVEVDNSSEMEGTDGGSLQLEAVAAAPEAESSGAEEIRPGQAETGEPQDGSPLEAQEHGMSPGPVASPHPSPHVVAAEAKVEVNPSMPARKPAALRVYAAPALRPAGGKPQVGTAGCPPMPKRTASQGVIGVSGLQSGGPLLSNGNGDGFIWEYSKECGSDPAAEVRRDEAGHHRWENGATGRGGNMKAAGSPPAPAPDTRRRGHSNADAETRQASSEPPDAHSPISTSRRNLEADCLVADERGEGPDDETLEGQFVAQSPQSQHGQTWQVGDLGDMVRASNSARPLSRARSRGDSSERNASAERSQTLDVGVQARRAARSLSLPTTGAERSLSPHNGQGPWAPSLRLQRPSVDGTSGGGSSRSMGRGGSKSDTASPLMSPKLVRSEGHRPALDADVEVDGDVSPEAGSDEEPAGELGGYQSPGRKRQAAARAAWDTPAPCPAWASPHSSSAVALGLRPATASAAEVSLDERDGAALDLSVAPSELATSRQGEEASDAASCAATETVSVHA